MKLYHDQILDHYHVPRNLGPLENFSAQYTVANRSCGDQVTVYLVCASSLITGMAHVGTGCVMSRATASVLSLWLPGKLLQDCFPEQPEDFITQLLKIEIGPVRLKCALLSLQAVQGAISTYQKHINFQDV